ncbi:MAG: MBL fold metallo-hydrolase, partial [Cucumibacter sp.]
MAVPAGLKFDTLFDPQHGKLVEVAPGIARLTAPNSSAYTFTGTNTYLVGDTRIAVIDPGPKNEAHLEALTEAIGGRKVEAVVLTHTHADHAGLARIVQNRVDAPLLFEGKYRPMRQPGRLEFDPLRWAHIVMDPDFVLQDTDAIKLDGVALTVATT